MEESLNSIPSGHSTRHAGLGDARLEDTVYHSVVGDLAKDDIERAIEWIGKLEDPQLRRRLRSSAISTLSNDDPESAIEMASALDDSEERSNLLHVLLGNLAFSDREIVQRKLLELPAGELADSAVFYVGQTMSLKAFDEAFGFGQTLPDAYRSAFMAGVILDTASKMPSDWVARIDQYVDEGKQRNFVYQRIAESWLGKDREAASEWLGGLPPSEARDKAVSTFAKELFPFDPRGALDWAASIAEEQANAPTEWASFSRNGGRAIPVRPSRGFRIRDEPSGGRQEWKRSDRRVTGTRELSCRGVEPHLEQRFKARSQVGRGSSLTLPRNDASLRTRLVPGNPEPRCGSERQRRSCRH